ncbi:fungal-specific transcription factor domain-containing protein [Gongronella butleri]|nr:fungal-specific transcription factor domain-containing protein [Gongronella butleri]
MSTSYPLLDIRPGTQVSTDTNKVIIPRTKRTRAKRSCDLCRKKKIRCDADIKKPCSGCAQAGLECEFLVEQKKRGPASGFSKKNSYVEALESRLKRMEGLLSAMAESKASSSDSSPLEDAISIHDGAAGPSVSAAAMASSAATHETNESSPASTSSTFMDDDDKPFTCSDLMESTHEIAAKLDGLTLSDYDRTSYIGISSGVHLLNKMLFDSKKRHRIVDQPNWIIEKVNDDTDEHILLKSVPINDMPQGYVDRSYAMNMHVPHITEQITDALVDMYFQHFHQVCPIINKRAFLEQYYYQYPSPCDEYLLSVVCATSLRRVHLLSPTDWPDALLGLNETKQIDIYKVLHAKVNSLLDIVAKRSRISTIQSLILLTLFVEPPSSDPGDASYWFMTGVTIRMAQDLGLHRSSSNWRIPEEEVELRRRIWFAIYLMDRWVTAELGRPISIHDHDFDVELPSIHEIGSSRVKDTSERSFVPEIIRQTDQDIANKTDLYSEFCYSATLVRIFGQVLIRLHSPMSKRIPIPQNQKLVPIFDQSLKNWKLSLPDHLSYDLADPTRQSAEAATLFLSYNCILLLLYRPFIVPSEIEHANFAFRALGVCTMAASNILSVTESMDISSLVRIPWTISIFSIFQASIIFLHNAKGENSHVRDQGIKNLVRCSRVMKRDCGMASSRISKLLQAIAAHFSVPLGDEGMSVSSLNQHLSLPTIKSRRAPFDVELDVPLGSKRDAFEPAKADKATCSKKGASRRTDAMDTDHSRGDFSHRPEHDPQLSKRPRGDYQEMQASLKSSIMHDAQNRIGPMSPELQHLFSTRPEDMYFTSMTVGNNVNSYQHLNQQPTQQANVDSESPQASSGSTPSTTPPQFSHPVHQAMHQQPPPMPQAPQQQQQQPIDPQVQPPPFMSMLDDPMDLSAFPWNLGSSAPTAASGAAFAAPPPAVPLPTTGPAVAIPSTTSPAAPNVTNLAFPPNQEQLHQFFLEQPVDMTCLASDVPLWNAPNSTHWEDWDDFLRASSNVAPRGGTVSN